MNTVLKVEWGLNKSLTGDQSNDTLGLHHYSLFLFEWLQSIHSACSFLYTYSVPGRYWFRFLGGNIESEGGAHQVFLKTWHFQKIVIIFVHPLGVNGVGCSLSKYPWCFFWLLRNISAHCNFLCGLSGLKLGSTKHKAVFLSGQEMCTVWGVKGMNVV